MKLDRVTFTGADESVNPQDLIALSQKYPWIEWGILFSINQGGPRFPGLRWIKHLLSLATNKYPDMKLSAHLCGKWVRDLVKDGSGTWWSLLPNHLRERFQRVQLNFHGHWHEPHVLFIDLIEKRLMKEEFILQCDGTNDVTAQKFAELKTAVPLFDTSGGAGVLPKEWPTAFSGVYCGYAGGLGPDSMQAELGRIAEAASDERFWIDMERKVRSEDDEKFDLAKVQAVLDIVAPFVTL